MVKILLSSVLLTSVVPFSCLKMSSTQGWKPTPDKAFLLFLVTSTILNYEIYKNHHIRSDGNTPRRML